MLLPLRLHLIWQRLAEARSQIHFVLLCQEVLHCRRPWRRKQMVSSRLDLWSVHLQWGGVIKQICHASGFADVMWSEHRL